MNEPAVNWIPSRSAIGISLIAGTVVVSLLLAWFAVKWQLGTLIVEMTDPSTETAAAAADAAASFSPNDPEVQALLGSATQDIPAADGEHADPLEYFRRAAELSPFDNRKWLMLARAYEHSGDPGRAEQAYQRAVELAPAYASVHWQFGNFLLRNGRADDAMAHLKKATEGSDLYRRQVYSLAWDYFEHDAGRVESVVAEVPQARAELALFFAERGAAADALKIWNTLSDEDKARHPAFAHTITLNLYQKKHFREALEFSKQSGDDPNAEPETIFNPSFEGTLSPSEKSLFGWNIYRNDSKLDISQDQNVRSEGKRSLRLTFKTYPKPTLFNVHQLIAVTPGARYRISFMLRVENLRTGGEPFIAITDATNDAMIAKSERFPLGTHDWQRISVEFKVPDSTDGINFFTSRENCGETCPISGVLWYDDVKLERL